MKRLIQGLDTTFTKTSTKENRLWAFVDSSYKGMYWLFADHEFIHGGYGV